MTEQTPPEGWFTFGTHVDSPGWLEFSDEVDEAGMPLWERPARWLVSREGEDPDYTYTGTCLACEHSGSQSTQSAAVESIRDHWVEEHG